MNNQLFYSFFVLYKDKRVFFLKKVKSPSKAHKLSGPGWVGYAIFLSFNVDNQATFLK